MARASIELRNVLSVDNFSFEGRKLYADLVYDQGKFDEAYGQYLRLVEQYPDTLDVRIRLAQMALRSGDWDELARHTDAALRLEPENPTTQGLQVAAAYREARMARNTLAAAAASETARRQLAETPDAVPALYVLIDWLYNGPTPTEALPLIDRLLERDPDLFAVHVTRVRILERAGRVEEIGAALRAAFTQFPEKPEISEMLVRWYLSRHDHDGAEAFLRAQAGADDADPEGHFAVVRMLGATRGTAAALAELGRLETANAGSERALNYALRSALLWMAEADAGPARATFERVVREAADGELRNEARAALARLALREGQPAEAAELVDTILEDDPSNVAALVLRGTEAIAAGDGAGAVLDLRRALDQDPRAPDTLLLLAEAQKLQGNVELAEQRLAQAVEISGSRAREAIVYARFQIQRDNLDAAQSVLADSFRSRPDLGVAQLLAQIVLQRGDAAGAAQLVRELGALGTPEAAELAQRLNAALLFAQNKVDESVAMLRAALDGGDPSLRTRLQLLRMQILTERFDEAETLLGDLKRAAPGTAGIPLLEASLLSAQGKDADAAALLRQLLAAEPGHVIAAQRLHALLGRLGQAEEAQGVLSAALEAQPEARALRVLRALELEQEGAHAQALSVYARLYEEQPSDLLVANNYANTLALHRTDRESLDRALEISRRLIGSKEPHFLDTIGLVLLRSGQADAALANLQAAARKLPEDAGVVFNLGLALAELGRKEEALQTLRRGIALAGAREDLPQYREALLTLRGLES